MPWYSLSGSGLIVRGNRPASKLGVLQAMFSNTLEQAAKQEAEPDAAAVEAGGILYEKGIMSEPPSSLKELLDLAEADDRVASWLADVAEFPLNATETPDPEPNLLDLAVMA